MIEDIEISEEILSYVDLLGYEVHAIGFAYENDLYLYWSYLKSSYTVERWTTSVRSPLPHVKLRRKKGVDTPVKYYVDLASTKDTSAVTTFVIKGDGSSAHAYDNVLFLEETTAKKHLKVLNKDLSS